MPSSNLFTCNDPTCPLENGAPRPLFATTNRDIPLSEFFSTTTNNPVRAERPPETIVRQFSSSERNTIRDTLNIAATVEEEGRFTPRRNCSCESCKHMRAEGSSLRPSVVHEYSFEPTAWTPKRLPRDPMNWFIGVELETDRRPSNSLSNQYAAAMKRPDRFWVAKRDGSVSGPEFASYPATMTWWKEHYEDFAEMFRMLIHAGFRSHDGGHAGMHVNVSKIAFDSGEHLARFMHLIHYSHEWSLIMSQRTSGQAGQWCGLGEFSNYNEILTRANAVMNDGRYYSNKYTAVNTPNGESRIEFRLPRGTLRIDRFFKNLEWTTGMVEFTREFTNRVEAVPSTFMSWVADNVTKYPNLFSFQNERSSGLVLAAESVNLTR